MDTLVQYIPESEVLHIAREVVNNLPPPQTAQDTWAYALLIISGWAVALGLAGFYWYQVKHLISALMEINSTMVAVKEHIQNKDVQDTVTKIREDVTEIKVKVNTL